MSSTAQTVSRPVLPGPSAAFLEHPDLPLTGLLNEQHVQQAFDKHSVCFGTAHNSIFTPRLTVWAWLSQVIFPDKSTAAACARVAVLLLALSRPRWSQDTGVYCRARSHLSAPSLQELAEGLADRLDQAAPEAWRWHGLNVKLGDGTTIILPDTQENQAAFPQMASQKKGLGFPILRLVALLSLATGVISGMAWGPYQGKGTGETALMRALLGRLKPDDVVVLDRYYGNYWMIALLLAAGVHICVRVHHHKKCDFRKGKRLGHLDHVVSWTRPKRPEWMSEQEYQDFPQELTLREIAIDLSERGYRSERVVVVTDLRDANAYPKDDIAELYKWRWQVEVDLRHIKATLQMRELSCKTPERVAAELWTHALAHNLVRKVMAQAALYQRPSKRPSRLRRGGAAAPLTPRQISFKAALQQLQSNWQTLNTAEADAYKQTAEQILTTLAGKRLRQRPGRQEPRAVKKRPSNRPVLTEARAEVKKRMAEGKVGKESGVGERRKR
jgi:putative transposase